MTLKRVKNVKKKKVVFEHFLSHLIGAIKEDVILCITMQDNDFSSPNVDLFLPLT